MLEELSKTSLVVLLDDGHFSGRLNEFLLQVQGGLSQGSLTQGKLFPQGSVLLASNQVEGERLSGRDIRFPFQTSGSGFSKEKEKLLEDFMAFMKNNKGLLTLWAVRHVKLFKDCTEKDVDKKHWGIAYSGFTWYCRCCEPSSLGEGAGQNYPDTGFVIYNIRHSM